MRNVLNPNQTIKKNKYAKFKLSNKANWIFTTRPVKRYKSI